ncbi:hypothetical protein DDN23_18770 [Vibrio cholerae]|nr:hypothetical protein [Vibrio cholerae]MDN6978222.1 hypothetical protein [Vibrio cholerae]
MAYNARLRGWQRITTKLKHNNCNHRGSMGLETPRVDSPFEAFVSRFFQSYCFVSINRRKSRSARITKRIRTFASSYL